MNPAQRNAHLEELSRLDATIRRATDVYTLKPIYDRLEELSRGYPNDAQMQNSIAAVRAALVAHGQKLVESQNQPPTTGGGFGAPPPSSGSLPTTVMPSSQMAPPPMDSPRTGPPPPSGAGAPPPPSGPPKPPAAAFNWKRAAGVGVAIGLLVAAAGIYSYQRAKQAKEEEKPKSNAVAVKTNPPGASIRVNGEVKCTSDCNIELAPGAYEVQAVLPGYESASSKIDVVAGTPANVDLTLQPLPLSVRLFTDYQNGKVTFDGQPYGDLQDGQLILDRIAPGKHTIKVTTAANEASFEFESSPGRAPQLTSPVAAKNTLAVLVANAGTSTKIHSSAAALKLAVDGNASGEVGPAGLDLANLAQGDREFAVTEGTTERKLLVSISAQPTLTAYLKLDTPVGSLFISTAGEDDVTATFNGRPVRTKSRNGQIRLLGVPAGTHTVAVAKDGYTVDPPQKVTIAKGQEARLEFKLRIVPKLATLRIRGAAPGTQVVMDGNPLGTVSPAGTLEFAQVAPGEHVVELRRDRFAPKRAPRQFRAGETVELAGADVTLSSAGATLRVSVNPANAQLTIKGPGDAAPRPVQPGTLQLSEGMYVITAKAPNHADRTQSITLSAGDNKALDFPLTQNASTPTKQPQQPTRRAGTMADWDDAGQWTNEGGWFRRKGGNVVTYGITPTQGTFAFNISRIDGRRLQWAVNIQDPRNYVLFQLERKSFIRREVVNGRGGAETKFDHRLSDKLQNYSVQIEISPNTVKTFLLDGTAWREVDSWSTSSRNLTQGKFGLVIPGGDIFGLSSFKFTPR